MRMRSKKKVNGIQKVEKKKNIFNVRAAIKTKKKKTKLGKESTALLGIDKGKLKLSAPKKKLLKKEGLVEKEKSGENECNISEWTNDDLLNLISRMEKCVPDNDQFIFKRRIEELDWNQICFDEHSPEDCKKAWSEIEQKLRKFRILKEVAQDVKFRLESGMTGRKRDVKKKKKNKVIPDQKLESSDMSEAPSMDVSEEN